MSTHAAAARIIAADCLSFRARRVSRAITRMYDDALRPLGIKATQLTLVTAIAMCGEGGAGMGRLADVLAMDLTTLSRNLRPLERAGYIRLARGEGDRRLRVAFLAADGRRLLEDALPRWRYAHARVVATLGEEAAAELRDRFDAVAAAAARMALPARSA